MKTWIFKNQGILVGIKMAYNQWVVKKIEKPSLGDDFSPQI